jgi:hypothetical protein
MTLTDGYTTPYPDIGTYTGACMTGGTAPTQGNSTLIQVPSAMGVLCATAGCGVSPLPSPPIAPLPQLNSMEGARESLHRVRLFLRAFP